MNFVFISPQFPHTYWNFCDRLRRNGVNVLAIGDAEYDSLEWSLKNCLTEYYKVDSMEDYSQMFRAIAFFSFKYGKIDWIESNNEYWLEQDARLRTDFNITTGIGANDIRKFKSKHEMKKYYIRAGIPVARCLKVSTKAKAISFIKEIGGYPVIAKPDNGVGASHTYKIESDEELDSFFSEKPDILYLMEEFIDGDIVSYDVITDSNAEPLFESMTEWPPSIADIVNNELDLAYYTAADVDDELREKGRAALKAFGVKSRFVHLEFFRLKKAKKGLGKKGAIVALEANMRPAGGYTPDMMNYAHSTDVYQIWADMVTSDKRLLCQNGPDSYAVYASRRSKYKYVHTDQEIRARYGNELTMTELLPSIWWGAMGNYMYMAHVESKEKCNEFIAFIQEKTK